MRRCECRSSSSGSGRVAAPEILLQSVSVSHLIREQKVHQIDGYLAGGEATGMVSLEQSLAKLVVEQRVTRDEALSHANSPSAVETYIKRLEAA